MKIFNYLIITILLLGSVACGEDAPTVSLGIDDTYRIARMQKLALHPALTGAEYRWMVDGEVVSTERDYIFLAKDEGTYQVSFDIIDAETPFHFDFTVYVLHEEVEYSPYISKVYEFMPGPGQFVNDMPKYVEGDTEADIIQKVEDCISGKNDVMVSLGSFGGYVTFGFDHTVVNVPAEKDFRIWGNAFYELNNPDKKGGSCEPGIVWVSYDANCNGEPDDEWYELAGSEFGKEGTRRGYSLTYYRPAADHVAVPDGMYIKDAEYIRWTDSEGNTGYVQMNIFHGQSYYPLWLDADSYTLTGSYLPNNSVDTSGNGSYYVLYSYDWGYVDNHPNDLDELNSFDIAWAVDADGKKVDLPGVDFIRVQTALNQYNGWIGETSTEISKAVDLHIPIVSDLPPDPGIGL